MGTKIIRHLPLQFRDERTVSDDALGCVRYDDRLDVPCELQRFVQDECAGDPVVTSNDLLRFLRANPLSLANFLGWTPPQTRKGLLSLAALLR